MIKRFCKTLAFATVLTFTTSLFSLSMAFASSSTSQKIDLEMTVRVNQQGFLDKKGKVYGPKHVLQLPQGKVVRIKFIFDEKMTSLAFGDTHQVAITGEGVMQESEPISMWQQQTSMTFQTGKEGSTYRAYCILDCIGMEHLNNLVIQVV